jgi:hypothetical protein
MNQATGGERMTFGEELRTQRWDDHRYYHRSRVNQALHFFSACCFLTTYVIMFKSPIVAAILGWVVAMWSRQIGHFFFEPKGYDEVNQATFEHKEEIKVGYNLQRKVILLAVWLAIPALLWVSPSFFGVFGRESGHFLQHLGVLWIVLGFAGVLARTAYLCATRNMQTGIVWCTKILTDPFHDFAIYHKAPMYLLKGEWIDPMNHVQARHG